MMASQVAFSYSNTDSDASDRDEYSDHVMVRGRRVDVPPGFRLAKGTIRAGDMYLSLRNFQANGEIVFISASRFVGMRPVVGLPADHACDGFAMIIRPTSN